MVAAVHYFATAQDQESLLDYLGEPESVILRPWPAFDPSQAALSRRQALASVHVTVVPAAFGPPSLIRPGDAAMNEPSKAGVFNRLNWQRLSPSGKEGLIDSNISPVLLWRAGHSDDSVLRVSEIGSQADSMSAVSRSTNDGPIASWGGSGGEASRSGDCKDATSAPIWTSL